MRASLALALGLLLVTNVASAQEDPRLTEARAHFEQGEQHAGAEEWALALQEYQQAQALMEELGDPRAIFFVYNVAEANFNLGNLEESRDGFQRYLDESAADSPNRDVAQNRIREVEIRLQSTAATEGGGSGESGGGGEVVSPIGVIIASVGAAAIIAGAVVGGIALSDGDAATADCMNGVCPAESEARFDDVATLAGVADGLLFGGLAVAATGVVLMFVLADSGDDASASAFCTPEGCAASVQGRF